MINPAGVIHHTHRCYCLSVSPSFRLSSFFTDRMLRAEVAGHFMKQGCRVAAVNAASAYQVPAFLLYVSFYLCMFFFFCFFFWGGGWGCGGGGGGFWWLFFRKCRLRNRPPVPSQWREGWQALSLLVTSINRIRTILHSARRC